MPSSRKAKEAICSLVSMTQGNIYDLGSGFGTLAIFLAKRFPSRQVVGYELSWVPWFISLLLIKLFCIKNLTIYRKDFFKVSLRSCPVVVCYLFPKAMLRLKKKFEEELSFPTVVISNSFSIPNWRVDKKISAPDLWRSEIFMYTRPV